MLEALDESTAEREVVGKKWIGRSHGIDIEEV
jgi:hypothetical protein